MKNTLMTTWIKIMHPVKNERGAQSLEWLGLAALLILILGIVSQAVSKGQGNIDGIVSGILTKIKGMVGN